MGGEEGGLVQQRDRSSTENRRRVREMADYTVGGEEDEGKGEGGGRTEGWGMRVLGGGGDPRSVASHLLEAIVDSELPKDPVVDAVRQLRAVPEDVHQQQAVDLRHLAAAVCVGRHLDRAHKRHFSIDPLLRCLGNRDGQWQAEAEALLSSFPPVKVCGPLTCSIAMDLTRRRSET